MNNAERHQLILEAIGHCAIKGINVAPQTWGIYFDYKKDAWLPDKPMKCCPLAAVLLAQQGKLARRNEWRQHALDAILNVNEAWTSSFQRGFDNQPKTKFDSDVYNMGKEFREKFV